MLPTPPRKSQAGCVTLMIIAAVVLIGARAIASWMLDYQWWREMGQFETWISMMIYGVAPVIVLAIIAAMVFWMAHARGMKGAGTRLGAHPVYARLTTAGALVLALLFAAVVIDSWAVVRFFGGRGVSAGDWRDPQFGQPLAFYLFDLPFYGMLLRALLGLCIVGGLVYYLTARAWRISRALPQADREFHIDLSDLGSMTALESRFLRLLIVLVLVGLSVRLYLDRYNLVFTEHSFMVGVDWVNDKITIPLLWLCIVGCLTGAALVLARRWRLAIAVVAVAFALKFAVPRVIAGVYVRPNELAIERAYIHRHIEATRQAFGLNARSVEKDFPAQQVNSIDVERNRPILDNVRLWDWRAFHDTVSQIQPLRPYIFSDSDVDRYRIDGHIRQVLLSPRELDLTQLGDARSRWTNPHLVYTHGYGIVMAEANRITANGLPVLFIENAPPEIHTASLKLTRPELYYSENAHEPVFVHTQQPEFNYPSGSDNVHTTYEGRGGFAIDSFPLRLAAAVNYGDWNILLTAQLNPGSRMMIHRTIRDRLATLAGFMEWDSDPYLVLSDQGRLVWIVDGYLVSSAHPYSRPVQVQGMGSVNYMRNSVKATVDAYDGAVKLYVFDPSDPLLRAYRNLFPNLFTDAAAMPADLRAHVRYPETIFRVQAEIYRTFHMRDPEAFYNKADLWDLARSLNSQEGTPTPATPTYLIAALPGRRSSEFLLMVPFTPHNKDNLIGLMAARCDGEQYGELVFLQLAKQEILLGPMQIEARINQDQNISKDLTLWNQQGSQVLRGQMLVLPVDRTFLYVEPIYIQAREARMPQLKKVVLAVGNTLIYADTYDQALAQLAGTGPPAEPAGAAPGPQAAAPAPAATGQGTRPAAASAPDPRIGLIRQHLQRYRDFAAQGRWAEAGKELEAVQAIVQK
jgi:uncharacterized membrane protein (UPF0182 family)